MSRNKDGLIHKRTCSECGKPTRNYRIVVKREMTWFQAKRQWLPERSERPVCMKCLHKVQHLDTVELIKNPELEVR